MTFTTLTFILFLPLVFAAYWALSKRSWQNALIVVASFVFYGWWDYRFCGLMLATCLVDFWLALAIARTRSLLLRRAWLAVSIGSNLGVLGFFKYYNFFSESFAALCESLGWQVNPGTLQIILPVGISFYTFQALSYTIDVYRGDLKATSNLIDYLAFLSFFPQLVAGPIERATNLLPQFQSPRAFHYDWALDGCRQMLWGFLKKIVIADALATIVNPLYAQAEATRGPELILATVCFAFQVYCDFSAYSDIATGCAKLFGIQLMRNFAYPFFSQSMSEFWGRWHISLSTWFRDYVYMPLGGSHGGRWRTAANVLVTFVISGLWHGAAWTYVIWGAINGVFVAAQRLIRPAKKLRGADIPGQTVLPRLTALARICVTFSIFCLGLVFFRAESVSQAMLILQQICVDLFSFGAYQALVGRIAADSHLARMLMLLAGFVAIEWICRHHLHPLTSLQRIPLVVRWAFYTLLLWGGLNLMPREGGQDFIYFAF